MVDSWPRALSCEDVWWTMKFAGPWLLVEPAGPRNAGGCKLCVAERSSEVLRRSDVDDDGASCYATSTRVIHTESQVAAESGLADAVRAINNLATAQVRKDTPSLIDVKGLGRVKGQWSKKTEAFFAGVIKESEMMLEWAAEQATEIIDDRISSSCRLSRTRGVQNLEFVLQQMHTALMALTSYEANDIVANSREEPVRGMAETAEAI